MTNTTAYTAMITEWNDALSESKSTEINRRSGIDWVPHNHASVENRSMQTYPTGIQSTPKSVSPTLYKNFILTTKVPNIRKARKTKKASPLLLHAIP